jgi:hypothetical protein
MNLSHFYISLLVTLNSFTDFTFLDPIISAQSYVVLKKGVVGWGVQC